jgi:hypothetical protein
VSLIAGLDDLKTIKKLLHLPGLEPRLLQPVAYSHTYCTIRASVSPTGAAVLVQYLYHLKMTHYLENTDWPFCCNRSRRTATKVCLTCFASILGWIYALAWPNENKSLEIRLRHRKGTCYWSSTPIPPTRKMLSSYALTGIAYCGGVHVAWSAVFFLIFPPRNKCSTKLSMCRAYVQEIQPFDYLCSFLITAYTSCSTRWPCHGSGGYSPASYRRSPGSISVQSMWELWWMEWIVYLIM